MGREASPRLGTCHRGWRANERSGPIVPGRPRSLSLIDLLAEVGNLGGQIVRSDDGFMVRGVDSDLLSPAILSDLVAHRSDLDMLVPSLTEVEGRECGRDEVDSREAEM